MQEVKHDLCLFLKTDDCEREVILCLCKYGIAFIRDDMPQWLHL